MSLEMMASKKLTDVGTRYQHLRELLDAWEQGLIGVSGSVARHDVQKVHLEAGVILLRKQIEVMSPETAWTRETRRVFNATSEYQLRIEARSFPALST